MARLKSEFLERVEVFCCRVIDVALAVRSKCPSPRVIDQLIGSGTSVGANLFEADEAMSRPDFVKCTCIAVKELNETRFWLRIIGRKGWIKAARLDSLQEECTQLKRILGAMIAKTKASPQRPSPARVPI